MDKKRRENGKEREARRLAEAAHRENKRQEAIEKARALISESWTKLVIREIDWLSEHRDADLDWIEEHIEMLYILRQLKTIEDEEVIKLLLWSFVTQNARLWTPNGHHRRR